MVAISTGNATPEKRTARPVLSPREPIIESLLVGLGIDADSIEDCRQFCKHLVSERNRWDVSRRRGGLFGTHRLSKDDAHRAFGQAFGEEARP